MSSIPTFFRLFKSSINKIHLQWNLFEKYSLVVLRTLRLSIKLIFLEKTIFYKTIWRGTLKFWRCKSVSPAWFKQYFLTLVKAKEFWRKNKVSHLRLVDFLRRTVTVEEIRKISSFFIVRFQEEIIPKSKVWYNYA